MAGTDSKIIKVVFIYGFVSKREGLSMDTIPEGRVVLRMDTITIYFLDFSDVGNIKGMAVRGNATVI